MNRHLSISPFWLQYFCFNIAIYQERNMFSFRSSPHKSPSSMQEGTQLMYNQYNMAIEGLPLNRKWHHFDWFVVDRCIEGLLFMSLVFVLGNTTMYSHYQSFFHTEMAEVAKMISHRGQGPTCHMFHTMAADNLTNEGVVSMDHFLYEPNKRRRYNVMLSLIDWVHTQNDGSVRGMNTCNTDVRGPFYAF